MAGFWTKLEYYLFDILGIILPGLVFITILILPIFIKIYDQIISEIPLLSGLDTLYTNVVELSPNKQFIIIIISSYLIGHFVKVSSKMYYDTMKIIFDKHIYILAQKLFNKICKKTAGNRYYFLRKVYKSLFLFEAASYYFTYQEIKNECVYLLHDRLKFKYPTDWHSLYKFGTMILNNSNTRSLYNNFLAKYNLYRSLSFIFTLSFICYTLFFFYITSRLDFTYHSICLVIIFTALLLGFTFHIKYKRYWTLCGNEALIALYYYLNKNKLK